MGRPPSQFVIGKHSSSASTAHALAANGIAISKDVAAQMLPSVRRLALQHKAALHPDELIQLFHELNLRPEDSIGTHLTSPAITS